MTSILWVSCKNKEVSTGKLDIRFAHVFDQAYFFCYTEYINEAGNVLEFTDLQYFISDIKLIDRQGKSLLLNTTSFAHYVDIKDSSSLIWHISDLIPAGNYKIQFTFGITQCKNISNIFPNQPESNMFWPAQLGGGYHYMKLNGRWKTTGEVWSPFGFHLGIGKANESDNLSLIDNSFSITPEKEIYIEENKTTQIVISMNIAEWFKNPGTWDFNTFGGSIMQNQTAQQTAKENGMDVFTIK